MIKSITKISCVALATLLAATVHGQTTKPGSTNSATSKLDSLLGDPIIAKGKGIEIKRSQLDAEMIQLQSMAAAQGRAIPPESLPMFQVQKLNDLIAFQLLLAKATDADKTKGKEVFAKALQRLKANNKLTDAAFDEKLANQLRLQGLTRAEWDKQRLDQATVQVVLQRELKIEITDVDTKKYYDENPTKFEQPEQVRASHILISTKDQVTNENLSEEQKKAKLKQIQDLRKRAVAGEDFAKLAKEFSEDPGSKDAGGEYTFGRGRMVPAFEAAAFSLNTNQISDVVTTDYGYHIIKLSEKMPAKVVSYAEVSDELKEALRAQELQKKLEDGKYLANLRKEANVELLDEKLKKLDETMSQNDALNKEAADAKK